MTGWDRPTPTCSRYPGDRAVRQPVRTVYVPAYISATAPPTCSRSVTATRCAPRGGCTPGWYDGDSGFLDEPATATALAAYVMRGIDCGAVEVAEVDKLIGIDLGRLAVPAVLARREKT